MALQKGQRLREAGQFEVAAVGQIKSAGDNRHGRPFWNGYLLSRSAKCLYAKHCPAVSPQSFSQACLDRPQQLAHRSRLGFCRAKKQWTSMLQHWQPLVRFLRSSPELGWLFRAIAVS
ncbi:hypothetical protein XANMN_22380 (plasmid) [Xanthomonas phaseoli pv. manihotis str. CIO151]|nr:hypothetical protein XANMN_22380 [Xanthomonas phaseoli pv. manihotis str. CIO151]